MSTKFLKKLKRLWLRTSCKDSGLNSFTCISDKDSLAVEKRDESSYGNYPDSCFSFSIASRGFSVKKEDIWFEQSSLEAFQKEVAMIADRKISSVKLLAMTELELTVKRVDDLGHFSLSFFVIDLAYKNSATVSVTLETQQLLDFANFLLR